VNLKARAVGLLRRLLVVLDPPPAESEKPLSDKDREALERLAEKLERDGRRQGMRAWNYHRPRNELSDGGDLRYMLDCYGLRGALERLGKIYDDRKANQNEK
jgi:hypothetical protein